MTPYEIVEKKLREGMIEGQMHGTLRDLGRLAGGYAAAGALSAADLAALERLAVSLCKSKPKGERTWREGLTFGRAEPVDAGAVRSRPSAPDAPLTWESEIGPGMTDRAYAPDYAEPIPPPALGAVAELVEYLEAMFEADECVSYVLGSFQDEDGKRKPMGRGVYGRTRSDIVADLRRYATPGREDLAVIECALGSWDIEAGGWVRVNPVDGRGVGNDNVTACRHVLVESDSLPVEKQLATIHSLNLPCTAIVHSGGKSVHALVRIDAGQDRALYRQRVEILFKRLTEAGFPVDGQCRNPSRLSRLPGLLRGSQRQYLVSGPCGAASWDDWEAESRMADFRADILDPERITAELPGDSLLGDRFLTRGGSWLLVAQSGIGKSVFALQGAVSFAVGRDLFGLRPAGPLRQLIVQAENNALDVQETYRGVTEGLHLSLEEQRLLRDNLRVVQADRYTGGEFCRFLGWLCQRTRPDVVWIDPLLAYIGGEISRMADCAKFLRNQLNPVIHDHNIGVVVVHHTGKPPKDGASGYGGADLAYLGIGSSDLTNWARATSTIVRCEGCDNRYSLTHAKRSARAGCVASTDVQHAGRGICWEPAESPRPANYKPTSGSKDKKDPADPAEKMQKSKYAGYGFEEMPDLEHTQPAADSPLLRWIQAAMADKGEPVTPAGAESIRRQLQRAGFIVFDKDAHTWRGVFYDNSFV